ncbi:hypothetical protein GH714_023557 [Hevea brasiliensis]|uniref:ABC-type xenobiotic transporter n=1 Tax=Hevea brasiliensis TaxID=3981 RepID=A0A6A6LDQ1_HEVBR|nr:hypothetical protein GH714_023557 [Hevea brasiliensis]
MISLSQAMISLERLDRYMLSKELVEQSVERVEGCDGIIAGGELTSIVGTVGSGKSSLLASALGEMHKISGKVRVCGTAAYVAQTSWIQNGTIQENILFGLPMDKEKYNEVIRVCCLEKDLEMMDYGDQTEIGERGINLSGGQKQRIQLARAVYQDCDIYLLDDVFSAVDAHTGSDIFKECVRGALKGKTILLVTHQVDFLHNVDLIMVMRDGVIVQSGKYNDLMESGMDFGALVAAHETAMGLVEEASHNTCILHAPMSFFDTTPSGRILSRASSDQSNVDFFIPYVLGLTVAIYIILLSIIIITCQYAWPTVFLLIPLGWLNIWYRGYFLATSRELTRLDSITKAPIIHHFSESISGVVTIRSFNKQERFSQENVNRVSANLRMDFHNNGSNEWLGFRLELIGSFILCMSAMFLIVLPSSIIRPGITLSIYGGEKIGVVGRTGSGKSTLIQVFFRLVEPTGGKIIIDGIDICRLGLHDLRSRFGIIPQEPVLFEGTVRSNIDPIGQHTDEDIWKSLERCQLKDVVAAKPEKLDASVVENGDNWSMGQRQLLCLGRVMLKRSRLLFMDEATASVDSKTDGVIQKIIREDFATCTIISIAHRIPTVMDCDRVLVIDAGWAKEFDKPSHLLERPSLFRALVQEYANRSARL